MKKILYLLITLTLTGMLLISCTPKSMKDGTYKAEFSTADSHGWTDYVEITVSGEKITKVDYDSLNAEGKRKSEDTNYNQMMKDAGSSTWPSVFYPKLEDNLIKAQKPSDIDIVAGATDSSNALKKLVEELEKNMSKGETKTLKVSR